MNKYKLLTIVILLTSSTHGISEVIESTALKVQSVDASSPQNTDKDGPEIPADGASANKMPYSVHIADIHLRNTLTRWSLASGWQFSPDQWTIPYDIPVIANANLDGDFKSSVRALLGATELTDMPLQPCFYSNQVLRVVPISQKCDRNID